MVEFRLPKNSRIEKGIVWPRPDSEAIQEFQVYRWNPDDGRNPRLDTYFVDTTDCGPMVLDGLIWIKNNIDSTLTFRRSCREGVCGSCSMNIAGQNTLACTKSMSEDIPEGEPLRVLPLPRHRRNGDRATRIGQSSMDCTSASSALAARRPVQATGGIPSVSLAQRP
jgi:succinate dehydrogenase / fumarate reductase, iron-sulfur subunit